MQAIKCKGFQAAGIAAGLKKAGGLDLGLIYSDRPASVAGVFTRNRVPAAPVVLDRQRVTAGQCQAVIANSGGANCCTGAQGMADAREMAFLAANGLNIAEEGVLVASTGVIGQRLPMESIRAGTPALVAALRPDGFSHLAEAIMTTDTHPKIVSRQAEIGGVPFSVVGVAKGSGMIRPDMATMLCFVCTDLIAPPETLQLSLIAATHRSFNRITVDGDTSTNDTILLLANGASGADIEGPLGLGTFQAVLDEVLLALAKMVVRDGEGASKLAEIAVRGAASDADAACVAQTVANSNLVKTALFGEDANWGRIMAAVGRAGVPVEPDRIAIDFNEVRMVEKGMGRGLEAEQAATEVLKTPEFVITIDLGMGDARDSVFTCDFSLDYVRINADYRS